MEDDLPAGGGAAPDGGAAGNAVVRIERLDEGVSGQEVVGGDLLAVEVADFPDRVGAVLIAGFKGVEDKFAAEASAGRADFPEFGRGHFFEVVAGSFEFLAMKDRFAAEEFVADAG